MSAGAELAAGGAAHWAAQVSPSTLVAAVVAAAALVWAARALLARHAQRRRVDRKVQLATVDTIDQRLGAAIRMCQKWTRSGIEQAGAEAEAYRPRLKRFREIVPALREQARRGELERLPGAREQCDRIEKLLFDFDVARQTLEQDHVALAPRLERRRMRRQSSGAGPANGRLSRFATTMREVLVAKPRSHRDPALGSGLLTSPGALSQPAGMTTSPASLLGAASRPAKASGHGLLVALGREETASLHHSQMMQLERDSVLMDEGIASSLPPVVAAATAPLPSASEALDELIDSLRSGKTSRRGTRPEAGLTQLSFDQPLLTLPGGLDELPAAAEAGSGRGRTRAAASRPGQDWD